MKQAVRIGQGTVENIEDLEVYKSENDHCSYTHIKDLYGIFGQIKRGSREYLLLIDESSLMGQILK
jgi:hypothetical protein